MLGVEHQTDVINSGLMTRVFDQRIYAGAVGGKVMNIEETRTFCYKGCSLAFSVLEPCYTQVLLGGRPFTSRQQQDPKKVRKLFDDKWRCPS